MEGYIEQLLQMFRGAVWDGNLISKQDRDQLVKSGLAVKVDGAWNILTPKGMKYLIDLGLAKP